MDFISRLEQPVFYQFLFLLNSSILTFISQSHLFYKCINTAMNDRLSTTILINMALWVLAAIAGIFYIGYMIISGPSERNGNYIFISGSAFVSLTTAVSLSVTFLLLDRIFILTMPMKYKPNQKMFTFITILACFSLFAYILIGLILTELPVDEKTDCNAMGCILKRHNGVVFSSAKIIIGFVNVIVAIIFQSILCNYISTTMAVKNQYRRANALTSIAAFTEFFCNFLPNLLWSISAYLQWEHLSRSGPYAALMIGVDALLTAFIYRFVITSKHGLCMSSNRSAWTRHSTNSRQNSVFPGTNERRTSIMSGRFSPTVTNRHEMSTLQMPTINYQGARQIPGSLQVPDPLYLTYGP